MIVEIMDLNFIRMFLSEDKSSKKEEKSPVIIRREVIIEEENKKQEVKKEEKTENKEKELNEQISKLKDELADVKDRHTRLIAEFDNLKKRSAKEREGLYNSIIGDIISSLLPVIDNLEKATEAETKDEEYKKGIELVLKQFKDVLTANGVKEIEAVGQPFDPELHEAVSMIQDEKLGEKIVAQEYRKGYMIGNKVIRHSMVVVAN